MREDTEFPHMCDFKCECWLQNKQNELTFCKNYVCTLKSLQNIDPLNVFDIDPKQIAEVKQRKRSSCIYLECIS